MECDQLEKWHKRIGLNEDDTENWLKVNSRPCPEC
jgi:hypothetical protein